MERAHHDRRGAWEAARVPPIVLAIDAPASCVVWRARAGTCHRRNRAPVEDVTRAAEPVDMIEEAHEVRCAGDPAAVGIHPRHVHPVGTAVFLRVVDHLAPRPIGKAIAADLHGAHPGPAQDVLLHESFVRHAGSLLDDASKDTVAEVRVGVPAARRKVEGTRCHDASDKVIGAQLRILEHGVGVIVRAKARGVGQQLVDGDPGGAGVADTRNLVAENAPAPEHAIARSKASHLNEPVDRNRRDRLGKTGDPKTTGRPHALARRNVGKAVALAEFQSAAMADRNRHARHAVLAHEATDLAGDYLAFATRRAGVRHLPQGAHAKQERTGAS